MFHILMFIYLIVLFIVLTPGILLRLPPKGTLLQTAIVHGIVFSIVFYLTHNFVLNIFYPSEMHHNVIITPIHSIH